MPGHGKRTAGILSAFLGALMERRGDGSREGRFERMKSDVAARLRHVCSHMSRSEFDDLVEQIVAIKIKYTFRRSNDLFLGIPEQPITDQESRDEIE